MYFVFLLVALLVFLFSWNNGSLYLGSLTASGLANFRRAAALISLAMITGILVEGWKMDPEMLAGKPTYLPALATILLIFMFSNLFDVPVSISNISVFSLVGASLALHLPLNLTHLTSIVSAWILSPLASMALTWIIYEAVKRVFAQLPLLTLTAAGKLTAYTITFYSAYTLSANNIGFLTGMVIGEARTLLPSLTISIILGIIFFSRKTAYMVGERLAILSPPRLFSGILSASIIVWTLTQLRIPGALTQTLLGGLIGAVTSSSTAILNTKLLKKFLIAWAATTLISTPISYILTKILISRICM